VQGRRAVHFTLAPPIFMGYGGAVRPATYRKLFVKYGFNVIVGARAQRARIYALNPYLTNEFEEREGGPRQFAL